MEARELIHDWLAARLAPGAREWLDGRREELATRYTDRALHITLGMIPRRLGKDDLALTATELEAAGAARPGWDPTHWGIADAARVLVLLETAGAGNQSFVPESKQKANDQDPVRCRVTHAVTICIQNGL